jgi:hypothetical protein
MAANLWMAVWGFVAGLTVTVTVTYCTEAPDPAKLKGLTYSRSASLPRSGRWYQTPEFYAAVVVAIFVYLNIKFF